MKTHLEKDKRIMEAADFGRALIASNDLDPVYVLLHEACLPEELLRRWLLAYWCFYHVGTASWCASTPSYWGAMRTAAASKDYPRCHERRHFRGAFAGKVVAFLESRGLDNLFSSLLSPPEGEWEASALMREVQTWYGFGPWIAFKVADMLERLGLVSVNFDTGSALLFDSPRQGAEAMWERYGQGQKPADVGEWAVSTLLARLRSRETAPTGPAEPFPQERYGMAPPRYDRPLNAQEAETVLCKWKSHLGGHYVLGEDIRATRAGLLCFSRVGLCQDLYKAGRRAGLWA